MDGARVLRLEVTLPTKPSHWPPTYFQTAVFTLESEDKGLEAIIVLRKRTSPLLHEIQTRKDACLNISSTNMEKNKTQTPRKKLP